MMDNVFRRYWLSAVTPLHVGTGQGVGFVDLPVARERATAWPFVPGSSVKGVVREYFDTRGESKQWLKQAFGTAGNSGSLAGAPASAETGGAQAGALVFTDSSIVCLPVRSLYGTFAYVSAPLVLQRLSRGTAEELPKAPTCGETQVLVPAGSVLKASDNNRVYLEDLDFDGLDSEEAEKWAEYIGEALFADDKEWEQVFKSRFLIISDDHFNFLCKTATEVNPRIRIDPNTGTVADGAYWYEENLPAETILSGLVWCDASTRKREEMMEKLPREAVTLQIGGHASTGHGRVYCRFASEGGSK